MPENRNVIISRDEKPVFFYNEKAEREQLGVVSIDQVQGESMTRQYFQVSDKNPFKQERNTDKLYNLGQGSKALSFIDPADSVEPLLNAGWKIESVMAHRGGTEIMTRLSLPDIEWSDPYVYDQARWLATDVHGNDFVSTIKASVSVRNSLHIGFCGAVYVGGLYRPLCGNGAEALILGLPSFRYSHSYWDISKADENLKQLGYAFKDQTALPTGPVICTLRTLDNIRNTLALYRDEAQGFSPRTERFSNMPHDMNVFRDMPDWVLNNFLDELGDLGNHFFGEPDSPVDALSILMAYTNAINYHRKVVKIDRGVWSAIAKTNDVIDAMNGIGQYLSFFGGFTEQPAPANVYSDLNQGGSIPKRRGYKIVTVKAQKAEEPAVVEADKPAKKHYLPDPTFEDVPEYVLYALQGVRESSGGTVNMKNRKDVIERVRMVYGPSAEWLEANPQYYFAALKKSQSVKSAGGISPVVQMVVAYDAETEKTTTYANGNEEPDVNAWLNSK